MYRSTLGLATSQICMGFEDWLESAARQIFRSVWGQAPLQLARPVSLWWICRGQPLSKQLLQIPLDLLLRLLHILVMLGPTLWQSIPALLQVIPMVQVKAWRCWDTIASAERQLEVPVHLHKFWFASVLLPLCASFLPDCWASWLQAQHQIQGHKAYIDSLASLLDCIMSNPYNKSFISLRVVLLHWSNPNKFKESL